ncbi:1-acylglycerol-3-phosphate O-acyltransferase [Streptomyces zinciresistens K42]|uniref:1-acylglycerol-3-phosphate O-acyltransferase n=1 Tax=Streptomyces zinciresistens K42 TaxID=700597 RepID=G2GN81_9ACTN|nr:1-acyl-sn-glycerol-3-phosphate acyltransferase [Streptomyces zinciresistens]EGX55029.1 1-acylglycerol-3-phosphate O-acyltransferase [Streptomyces zinciresistens K42]
MSVPVLAGSPEPAAAPTRHAPDAGTLWRPSAPCAPRTCTGAGGPTRLPALAALRFAAVLFLLLAGCLAHLAAGLLGRHLPAGAVRLWCRWVVRACGVRPRIDGAAAPDGGLLLVANHVSWLDIPLIAAVRPARMLAKSEIRAWPVAGRLTARGGALFIDRDRVRALPATVARIAAALRSGDAVAVFPEGSTWCGRARGRFRRAAFQAALDAGVPVQPVRLDYRRADGETATAAAFVGDDTLLASVWRVASTRGLTAEVRVARPIAPGSHPDRARLARAAETAVLPPEHPAPVPGPRRIVFGPRPGVLPATGEALTA